MRIIKLSNEFYKKYGECSEIMKKQDRPYYCLTINVKGTLYAIPFRHFIKHEYAFHTIGDAGIDYSKAVIVENNEMISGEQVRIDSAEWSIINSNEDQIFIGFSKYLRLYERAKKHPDVQKYKTILDYSTLKYFD